MRRSTRVVAITTALLALAVLLAGWLIPGFWPQSAANAVKRADSMILYEGLPHHLYEEQLLAQERATKACREIGEYPFYQVHMVLEQEDVEQLVNLLGNPVAWEPFSIGKACGGFHPDYAVEFWRGAARWQVLICFGCGEAMVFSPWGESRYDLSRDAKRRLYAVLAPYQKNRPASEHRTELEQCINQGW